MRKTLGTMAALIIIVAAVGYYRGWFSISRAGERGGDRVSVGVLLDKAKAKSDLSSAGEKLQRLAERGKEGGGAGPDAGEKAAGETARASGKIVDVDASGCITIATPDGTHLPVDVPNVAEVTVDGRDAAPAAMKPGDQVVVHYRVAEGKNIATELSVTRPS